MDTNIWPPWRHVKTLYLRVALSKKWMNTKPASRFSGFLKGLICVMERKLFSPMNREYLYSWDRGKGNLSNSEVNKAWLNFEAYHPLY